ncbi:MAG: hypothetical protein Ta2B_05910 [Termitinemataceae bacterium]|nr:MAG: hypothetical protein Ta2B_05910 [Termitinemataceae bacterium]
MIALRRTECPKIKPLQHGNCNNKYNKTALSKSTFQKCMYCENKIGKTDYPHVEHIKPKSKFPDLEFVWDNLGWSCGVCNINKGNRYDKMNPLINPYNEDPEKHITFLDYYAVNKKRSKRGIKTIYELQLNRTYLIEGRKEHIEKIALMTDALDFVSSKTVLKKALAIILGEAACSKKYSAMVKCFFRRKKLMGSSKY